MTTTRVIHLAILVAGVLVIVAIRFRPSNHPRSIRQHDRRLRAHRGSHAE